MFNRLYKIVETDYKLYRYKILQRHTILLFIHWWSTPEFAPPHLFEKYESAFNYIIEQDSKANIINDGEF